MVNTLLKFKVVMWLFLACVFVSSAVAFFGVPVSGLPESGGKAGAFLMLVNIISMLIEPLFVNYSVSVVYILISIIPFLLAFSNYRKLKSEKSAI